MRAQAEASAYAERTTAEANAEANAKRAESLREGNQELIAANHLVEVLPAIVEAASRGLTGANVTVLNGASGVNEVLAGLITQGASILDTARRSLSTPLAPSEDGPGRADPAARSIAPS